MPHYAKSGFRSITLAVVHRATLVTMDGEDFGDLPRLMLELLGRW